MASFPWVELTELREKYTYDIHPFTTFRAEKKREKLKSQRQMNKPRKSNFRSFLTFRGVIFVGGALLFLVERMLKLFSIYLENIVGLTEYSRSGN